MCKTLPDGTKVRQNEDGSSVTTRIDGSKLHIDADGTEIDERLDGVVVQRNPDGVVIETWPDGRRSQLELDGVRIDTMPDGSRVQVRARRGEWGGGDGRGGCCSVDIGVGEAVSVSWCLCNCVVARLCLLVGFYHVMRCWWWASRVFVLEYDVVGGFSLLLY